MLWPNDSAGRLPGTVPLHRYLWFLPRKQSRAEHSSNAPLYLAGSAAGIGA